MKSYLETLLHNSIFQSLLSTDFYQQNGLKRGLSKKKKKSSRDVEFETTPHFLIFLAKYFNSNKAFNLQRFDMTYQ